MIDIKDAEMMSLIPDGRVFTPEDIRKLFDDNRKQLPYYGKSFKKFLGRLFELGLTERNITDNKGRKKRTVFTTGKYDDFECISKIADNAYFSHHTALFLNDMHEYTPKAVYVSYIPERAKDIVPRPVLTQERIDAAFSSLPSEGIKHVFNQWQIILHASESSNRTGIIKNSVGNYYHTDPERTIIDSLIRPDLSGGILNLIEVLIHFKGKYSLEKIRDYLLELNYEFPYHQAMGFLLETAGYESRELTIFQDMGNRYKFYLDRDILYPYLDEKWNLVHPEEIY